MLEKFKEVATWKIANFQKQIHTHFRNLKHLHEYIFIHNHPIVLSWPSKEVGPAGGGMVDQMPSLSLRKIR